MARNDRKALVDSVMITMRDTSASSLLMRQEFAKGAGMNSSDAECVDFLRLNGPVLSSDIALHFGLTKGAITAMIRRLKLIGIVSTQVDNKDKRKLWISVDTGKLNDIVDSYKKLADATVTLLESYSEEELMTIRKFNLEMGLLYSNSRNSK